MTAGEFLLRRSIRETARINWHRIADHAITTLSLGFAVAAFLYAWMN